ncbi:glycerate kinase [Actinomyces sp. 565]|uniref:glycerate kinase n=1 Tax=Actinomyces sp. 565 TaxID=2057794 RepID=UPI0013A69134|nr:glycerate kinase [Actinomyces sp. 565]NDR53938.1 glycerate kinase [Actinomyces sp. 565]
MKFALAPDSFKENMTALQAAQAMARGVLDVHPDAETVMVPMSDGGEGFVDAVTAAWGAEPVEVPTVDALGRPLRAAYGLDGDRAVMDVASCAGLELIAPADRDVLHSNTAGLGVLIGDAVGRGARRIILGIGGSATNDAGLGMLTALGARLLGEHGEEISPYPDQFDRIVEIDTSGMLPQLAQTRFQVACDVTNPLTGADGATAVFGPQKGVSEELVPILDSALAHVARLSGHEPEAATPGAGAAGGLGFALRAFLGAELEPGVELVAQAVGLADAVVGADLVLTGEGSVDAQTLAGKTPAGVARLAAEAGVPCVVFAGRIKAGAENLLSHGVKDLVKVGPPDEPLEQALRHGQENLRRAVGDYLRR